jgi:uncharacterized membrane protein YdjX (TVP38/TMEM64 family)
MGFDTECNLALEARGEPRVRSAIARLRDRLLAEHLGVETGRVAQAHALEGGLIAAIESLRGGGRSLAVLEPHVSDEMDALVPDAAVIDPERALLSDEIMQSFVPEPAARPLRYRLVTLGLLIVAVAVLASAWRWTPLHDWLNLDRVIDYISRLDDLPATPLWVLAVYVLAGFILLPLTLLIAATGVVFGPAMGAVYALAGSVLSGLCTYALGRRLGRETVRRLAGERLNGISRKLGERGLLAVVLVRIVPVAPYSVVNIVAGASHIGLRDFLLGTLIGLLPGVLGTVVFVDRVVETLRHPGPMSFALLALIAGVLVGGTLLLNRHLVRRPPRRGRPAAGAPPPGGAPDGARTTD